MVISLLKTPYVHCIFMVLTNPTYTHDSDLSTYKLKMISHKTLPRT
jgi:hypothetical protein